MPGRLTCRDVSCPLLVILQRRQRPSYQLADDVNDSSGVCLTVQDYLAYETKVVLEQIMMKSLNLPALTVCNHNPIRFSKKTLLSDELQYVIDKARYSVQQAGHQMQDMVLWCLVSGKRCGNIKVKPHHSRKYNNCYTLDTSVFRQIITGVEAGLEFALYLEPDEYLPGISDTKGIHLQVHPNKSYIYPEFDGIALTPGMMTYMALTADNITRLGKPYSSCVETDEYIDKYGFAYNIDLCIDVCYLQHYITNCGCYDSDWMNVVANPNNVTVCDDNFMATRKVSDIIIPTVAATLKVSDIIIPTVAATLKVSDIIIPTVAATLKVSDIIIPTVAATLKVSDIIIPTVAATLKVSDIIIPTVAATLKVSDIIIPTVAATLKVSDIIIPTVAAALKVSDIIIPTVAAALKVSDIIIPTVAATLKVSDIIIPTVAATLKVNDIIIPTVAATLKVSDIIIPTWARENEPGPERERK
ncbi:hypothetical protein Btru_051112 [Bulinus truncatus]|nr:hypothetical protein Btru_051112 [Bulinus truncatus]